MDLKYFNCGFNYSQDGPSNRLVYHLQGCNLKCPWCANPEGIPLDGALMSDGKANGKYCSRNAITNGNPDRKICKTCEKICVKAPGSGVKLSCKTEPVEKIADYISTCKPMFFDGGGVTFTGGEPTIQFDSLKSLLEILNHNSINTAIECNGTHPRLPELFNLTDYLIIDCKHYDSEKHNKVCGLPNDKILNNIRAACELRNQLLVRIPLIGGFNSSYDDALRFAKLFRKICADFCEFEFLRYHEFGKDKYAKCGLEYSMTNEAFVKPETVKEFETVFKKYSLKTIHT